MVCKHANLRKEPSEVCTSDPGCIIIPAEHPGERWVGCAPVKWRGFGEGAGTNDATPLPPSDKHRSFLSRCTHHVKRVERRVA